MFLFKKDNLVGRFQWKTKKYDFAKSKQTLPALGLLLELIEARRINFMLFELVTQ